MSTTPTTAARLRRGLATGTVVGLGVAGLALLPAAPATAEPAPSVLAWEISPRFDDHLSNHVLADGATEDADGVITFPNGEGSYDLVTGVTEVAFDGSVEGSFAAGGSTFYKVTIAEPVVSVDAEGEGEISAVVSAWNAAAGPNPEASTEPARVVVTTFEAGPADWTAAEGVGTLTTTPDWAGVLPSGPESTALGIPDGQPVEGKSFAPAFLGQLTPGVRAHFYASGSGSDPTKQPSAFTASVAEAAPAVTLGDVTVAPGEGVTVPVSGTGFRGITNPGDNGIYVGLAPAGGFPDFDNPADGQDYFAAANYLPAALLGDGTFTTSLVAPMGKLDPRKSYAVYTWQAHTHSNPSQDTETPVTIDWAELGYPVQTGLKVSFPKKPTPKKAGSLEVAVGADSFLPTGRVDIKLKQGGKNHNWSKALQKGELTVRVPKLAKGKWKLTVTYRGSAVYAAKTINRDVKIG